MEKVVPLIQAACILAAAAILGNWFLSELRRSRASGKPWYSVYFSIPGIIIIAIILLLPVIAHFKWA